MTKQAEKKESQDKEMKGLLKVLTIPIAMLGGVKLLQSLNK